MVTLAGLTLVGCASGSAEVAPATVAATPEAPSPSIPASTPPQPSATAPQDSGPSTCADSILRSVRRTIDGQFDAFATADYPGAYALASRGFRKSMDVDVFALVIETDFPMLLESTEHAVEECTQPAPGTAVAVVAMQDANGREYEIVYRLLLEPGGWRVDGAGNPVPRVTA